MKYARMSLMVLVALLTLPVFADVVDDCIKLAQGGVGDEVIVAWSERQGGASLTAADVLRLKDGKVPDRAIATLLRAGMMAQAQHDMRMPMQPQQPAPAESNVVYSSSTPATTYVYSEPSPVYSTYYSSAYPYYYGGYYYPSYYSGLGLGLSFNFGRGYYGHGGYYGGGYYGHGGYSSGYSGGYSGSHGGYSGSHSGFSGGYSGSHSGSSGGFSGSHGGRH